MVSTSGPSRAPSISSKAAAAGSVTDDHDDNHDDDPAKRFFDNFVLKHWTISAYLTANKNLLPDGFDALMDSWVRELQKLAAPGKSTARKQKAAAKLLERYRNGEDSKTARHFRNATAVGKAQPNIIISGRNTVGVVAVESNVVTKPAAKRKRTADRKRKSKRRPAEAPCFLKHFRRAFLSMTDDHKWKLPSGLYAENVLFTEFRSHPHELAVHSWIIDLSCPKLQALFSSTDWAHITSSLPALPDLSPALQSYIVSLDAIPASDLRTHFDTTPALTKEEIDSLDPDTRNARSWIYDVLRLWTKLSQNPALWEMNHREFWYVANVWAPLFDACMTTLKGAYVSRGESSSVSTSARKNASSDSSKRRKIGHLYDGVLHMHSSEIGAAEHARVWSAAKWGRDKLKVEKVLHDMLYAMGSQAEGVQVVGLVTAAWKCQLLKMGWIGGYCCGVAGDTIREVPRAAEKRGALRMGALAGMVWRFRGCLESSGEETAERLLEGLMQGQKVGRILRSVETDADCSSDSEEWVDEEGEEAESEEEEDDDEEQEDDPGEEDVEKFRSSNTDDRTDARTNTKAPAPADA